MAVRRLGGRIVAFAATVALSIPLGLLTNSAWAVEDATRSDSTTQMSSTPEVVYSSAVDSKQNRTSDFDANWKFMLSDSVQAQDPAFDDSAWQQVDLPHDYSITQKYSQSNEAESAYLPGGTGWYRKSFTIDRDLAGKRIAINFDGVYMNATVWFNLRPHRHRQVLRGEHHRRQGREQAAVQPLVLRLRHLPRRHPHRHRRRARRQ